MIITILIISIAFLWLLIETKWLTIRLPQYYRKVSEVVKGEIDVSGLLMMGIGMVFLAIGFLMSPFRIKKMFDRAESPIPASIYNRIVWVKTTSGKTQRQVPYYAAVKIRQRLGGDISVTRPKGNWWYRVKYSLHLISKAAF